MKSFDAELLLRRSKTDDNSTFKSDLKDALIKQGVFQISNAEVLFDSPDCLTGAVTATKAFFDLPVEEKRRYERRPGLTAMGWSNRELTKQVRDEKELMDICWVPFPDKALDHSDNVSSLDGFNPGFPSSEIQDNLLCWYSVAVERVCFTLLRIFAEVLDMEFEAVRAMTLGENSHSLGFMRLNYYASYATETSMNIHEHTDAGLFTVLWASDVRGLQYQDRHTGRWEGASQANTGALTLTINVGDMFEVLTNGKVRAPVHRVICEPGCPLPRYSIALFFNPSEKAVISPMITKGDKKLYRDIPWAEFRRRRFEGDAANIGRETQVADYKL